MTFAQTLVHGAQRRFDAASMTPMQKMTLRFVVVGLFYFLFALIEGTLMRIYQVRPIPGMPIGQYYGILTAHPLVGIFGSSYALVMGAFLFLVPFLMKKPLWSIRLGNWTWATLAAGTITFWLAGFISHYSPLYTLYWPLPADFSQFNVWGGIFFIVGIAVVMVATTLFIVNVFATLLYTPPGAERQPRGRVLSSALGPTGLANLFRRSGKEKEQVVSLPVSAIAIGSVDMAFNVAVILFTGVLILVYMIGHVFGIDLKDSAIDALLYKNWFWWGLDLIADGLVLVFVAGSWYLLATLISGRQLFMEKWARAALFVELVVSWVVWSHHLMSDQPQPAILKVISGEMVTSFELITQGLAFFIVLVTLWQARPLKMSNPLKFLFGGLFGFALAVPAGIVQADLGMNRLLHNTQWIVGPHVHVAILVGLTMTLYAAVYFLLPLLTNGAQLYSERLASLHFWCFLLGAVGMGAFMGMAGLQGMLRRVVYIEGQFQPFMILAALAGTLIAVGFLAFLFNIVMTLGLKGLAGIFTPSTLKTKELVPAEG